MLFDREWLRGLLAWTSRVRTEEYGDAWESSTRRVPGKASIKPVAENNVIELWSACLVQSPIIIVVHHPKAQNNQVEKWHQQPKLSYDRESTRNSLQSCLFGVRNNFMKNYLSLRCACDYPEDPTHYTLELSYFPPVKEEKLNLSRSQLWNEQDKYQITCSVEMERNL